MTIVYIILAVVSVIQLLMLASPMIKGNLNKQFVEGLNNIKAICEN